jgi:hypothetical protein
MLMGAHTLEIGSGYFPSWYDGFREDLEKNWPQLKVIRFAISDGFGLARESYFAKVRREILQGRIENLVRYRFEHGRPFSAVERMVDRRNEGAKEWLDYLWGCFYESRKLGRYVIPT